MKHNIEIWSAVAGGVGALLKALRKYKNFKNLLINSLVGLFLGFVVVQGVINFVADKEYTISLIIAIGWVSGWLSNEITDKLEALLEVIFDSASAYVRNKADCEIEEDKKDE